MDAATASLLTGDAYLRRFFEPRRLEAAARAMAAGTPERQDGNVVKRALWLLALRAELGDGAVGRTRGAERLGARLAALRRVAGRRGRPIGLG